MDTLGVGDQIVPAPDLWVMQVCATYLFYLYFLNHYVISNLFVSPFRL